MKVSDLIQRLEKLKDVNGDLDCFIPWDDETEGFIELPVIGFAVCHDTKGAPDHVLICDDDTLDVFVDPSE